VEEILECGEDRTGDCFVGVVRPGPDLGVYCLLFFIGGGGGDGGR
jgi:hypothetical protein